MAPFGSIADEISGLAEWLEAWLGEGVRPKEIAIFGQTEAVLHDRAEPALDAAGVKGQLLNDDDPADEDHVSLGRMHRAKGWNSKPLPSSDATQDFCRYVQSLVASTTLLSTTSSSSRSEIFCTWR